MATKLVKAENLQAGMILATNNCVIDFVNVLPEGLAIVFILGFKHPLFIPCDWQFEVERTISAE
jgi:hypothetical protein